LLLVVSEAFECSEVSEIDDAYPVHEADISQHKEIDLEKQSSFCRSVWRYAPDGDSQSMEEAHCCEWW
jgi:hypothetical protein